MRILVPIKQCPAVGNQVFVEGSGETSRVLPSSPEKQLNPFCAIALEQAVRLKESKVASEVLTLSIGAEDSQKVLQKTLSLGADKAISCRLPRADASPLYIAKIIKKFCESLNPGLVILGKQSIDYDNAQVGPMLAALLAWPQAIAACGLSMQSENTLTAACEGDDGEFSLALSLPAVITADLRLCEPRTASLAAVMRSRRQTIEEVTVDSLGLGNSDEIHKGCAKILNLSIPRRQSRQQVLNSVDELAALIKTQRR